MELSDRMMSRLTDLEKRNVFARKMEKVTFIFGIVQGITAYSIFKAGSPAFYWIAFGFTLFSIASVSVKLKGKINAFPLLKSVAYVAILIVLLKGSRALFLCSRF